MYSYTLSLLKSLTIPKFNQHIGPSPSEHPANSCDKPRCKKDRTNVEQVQQIN